ncbi:MAG: purine/pyrimidine permease [Alphaproteobacteria bacterium]|nr:purine/pyrimidine permease [Alphaproteobacteria bacterium]
MLRPSNLVYGVADKPPSAICLGSAVQLAVLVAPPLIYPIIVMREAGADDHAIAQVISLSFLALGIAAPIQALTCRWIGSGYLIAVSPAAVYVPVAIAAIKAGGTPLLMGMTLFAGLFEIAFAQIVRRVRAFFPAEVSGLCVLLIGMIIGILGLRTVFGIDERSAIASATSRDLALSVVTLALMVGLNLWGKGALRMFCAAIGIGTGYLLAIFMGVIDPHAMHSVAAAPLLAWPDAPHALPTFKIELAVPFMIAALTCALRAMGDITAAQRINDREWLRPDIASIRNGIVANGTATMLAALAGGIGGNTQSSSIGMSTATGVAARQAAYWLGPLLIALSAIPAAAAVLVAMPRPIVGASLLFTSCFVVVSGLQIITSRLLDPRRTFVVGLALILSLGYGLFPQAFQNLPPALQSLAGSGLAIGLISALALNAVFRIGVRSKVSTIIAADASAHDAIRAFVERQGAQWGARRDVIERATFGTAQAAESIIAHCTPKGPLGIEASFDEFNLDIALTYHGETLALPDRRPTDDEIRDTDDGVLRLAGYLLKNNADHARAYRKAERAVLAIHFQH